MYKKVATRMRITDNYVISIYAMTIITLLPSLANWFGTIFICNMISSLQRKFATENNTVINQSLQLIIRQSLQMSLDNHSNLLLDNHSKLSLDNHSKLSLDNHSNLSLDNHSFSHYTITLTSH